MADVPYIAFSFICFFFNIAPLCWQFQHGNSGPVCLGVWVVLTNLNGFINTTIWRNDAINRAPIWCDISVKVYLGGSVGMLCAFLCIARSLATILRPDVALDTLNDRRKRAIFDYSFCFGLPAFVMAAHIVYQPNVFAIGRTMGCMLTIAITWPTYVLWLLWLPLLAFAGSLYSFYIIWRLFKCRHEFRKILGSASTANPSITLSRFVRLVILSSLYFSVELPLTIYSVMEFTRVAGPYLDYSWAYIHAYFDVVTFLPFISRANFVDWTHIISGLLVLLFFGFSGEAATVYGQLFSYCRGPRLLAAVRTRRPMPSLRRKVTEDRGITKRQIISICRDSPSLPTLNYHTTSDKDLLDKEPPKDFFTRPFDDIETLDMDTPLPEVRISRIEDQV